MHVLESLANCFKMFLSTFQREYQPPEVNSIIRVIMGLNVTAQLPQLPGEEKRPGIE